MLLHTGSLHFLNNPRTGHRVICQSSPSYEVEDLEFKDSRLKQGLVVSIHTPSSYEQARSPREPPPRPERPARDR